MNFCQTLLKFPHILLRGSILMKDLKHLLYFENLLQNAGNELIDQAKSDGGVCVAYVCENTPEPLLNLGNAFSIRLRAPRTNSMREEPLDPTLEVLPDEESW